MNKTYKVTLTMAQLNAIAYAILADVEDLRERSARSTDDGARAGIEAEIAAHWVTLTALNTGVEVK